MAAKDIAVIGVLVFAIGIAFFITNFMVSQTLTGLTSNPKFNESSNAVDAVTSAFGNLTNRLDYVGFAFFIALVLALIISAWFIGGNPVFMFLYFVVVVIALLISPMISNVWETVTTASTFGTTISAFPIMNHILLKLPLYVGIVGVLGIIVMFAKPQIQQQ